MNAEKLSISLPADMAKMVRSRVATGAYSSNSEVIRDALRLRQQRPSEQTGRLDMIRAKIDEADADSDDLPADQVRAHFEQRLVTARRKPTA